MFVSFVWFVWFVSLVLSRILLFGEGGDYGSKDLRARTEILDELGTTIDLFYEEPERFERESMKRRTIELE